MSISYSCTTFSTRILRNQRYLYCYISTSQLDLFELQSLCEQSTVLTAEVAAVVDRLISTIIQHVAGVNVQLWLWYKAQILYSVLLHSTQSAAADELRADCCYLVSGLEVSLVTGSRFTRL